jgi:hypothetical protein
VVVEVVTVRLEEPDPATEVGTKEAEVPEGNPLTEKVTVSANPFRALIEVV